MARTKKNKFKLDFNTGLILVLVVGGLYAAYKIFGQIYVDEYLEGGKTKDEMKEEVVQEEIRKAQLVEHEGESI